MAFKKCPHSELGAAVLDLREKVEPMADSHGWLTAEDPDPHQGQADPCQPVLARLAIGVEERPDTLRSTQIGRYMCLEQI